MVLDFIGKRNTMYTGCSHKASLKNYSTIPPLHELFGLDLYVTFFDGCLIGIVLIFGAEIGCTYSFDSLSLSLQVLFEPKQWDILVDQFKQEFCKLYGMTLEPLLTIYLQAGLSALKTPYPYTMCHLICFFFVCIYLPSI